MAVTVAERIETQAAWQVAMYGEANERLSDGTGPDVEWLRPVVAWARDGWSRAEVTAKEAERLFREEWDFPKDGTVEEQEAAAAACTWMRILREEVAEAFAADSPEALVTELVQIAAVAQNWAEAVERRNR